MPSSGQRRLEAAQRGGAQLGAQLSMAEPVEAEDMNFVATERRGKREVDVYKDPSGRKWDYLKDVSPVRKKGARV